MRSRCFSILSDRPTPWEIDKICWNPSLDVVALTSFRGEILLQRLFWKKAWTCSPPQILDQSECRISSLCWLLDGKFLTVAYESPGLLRYIDLETGKQVHCFRLKFFSVISTLSWFGCEERESWIRGCSEKTTPHLPSLSKDSLNSLEDSGGDGIIPESWAAYLVTKSWNYRYFLVAGSQEGSVVLIGNGLVPLFLIDVQRFDEQRRLGQAVVKAIFVDMVSGGCFLAWKELAEGGNRLNCRVSVVDWSRAFGSGKRDCWRLVNRTAELHRSFDYLDSVIQLLQEGWENVLMEFELKFSTFAKEKFMADGGSVGDDLYTLLMLGTPSPELEHFLLHTLTHKEIKKISQFLDRCYQKSLELVSKNLCAATASLCFHLSVLKNNQLKGDVCNDNSIWAAPYKVSGTLALKAAELRGVLARSCRELRTFFKWLHRSVLLISEEQMSNELENICAEEIGFILEFIRDNFMQVWSEDVGGPVFRLERVSQYFETGPLVTPAPTSSDPWTEAEGKFWMENGSGLLFSRKPMASLVDLIEELRDSIESAEENLQKNCSQSVYLKAEHTVAQYFLKSESEQEVKMRFSDCGTELRLYCSSFVFNEGMYLAVLNKNCGQLVLLRQINWRQASLYLLDFECFTEGQRVLCLARKTSDSDQHFGVGLIDCKIETGELENSQEDLDLSSKLSENNFGLLDRGTCSILRISEKRGVGCVLTELNRRVILLDLDPASDETTSSSFHVDISENC